MAKRESKRGKEREGLHALPTCILSIYQMKGVKSISVLCMLNSILSFLLSFLSFLLLSHFAPRLTLGSVVPLRWNHHENRYMTERRGKREREKEGEGGGEREKEWEWERER